GIAAATVAYGAGRAVVFRSLPYRDPHQLELIAAYIGELQGSWLTPAEAAALLKLIPSSAAISDLGFQFTWTGHGDAQRVFGAGATSRFFSMLGVTPLHGRDFRPDDDKPGAKPVVLLSYGFWQERLGGDPGILGRMLILDNTPRAVIGVLPPGF